MPTQDVIVVDEADMPAVLRDVAVGGEVAEQLGEMRREHRPGRYFRQPRRDGEEVALLNVAGADRREVVVEHLMVRRYLDHAATRFD